MRFESYITVPATSDLIFSAGHVFLIVWRDFLDFVEHLQFCLCLFAFRNILVSVCICFGFTYHICCDYLW